MVQNTPSNLAFSKQRIRIAATSLFIAQGLAFATWASRLPDISDKFGVKDLMDYGYLMFLIPIGKFLAIPSVGYLFPRIGSKKTVFISILGFILTLPIIGFIPSNLSVEVGESTYSLSFLVLGLLMLLFGTFWNMTDISLNTQAIEVEKLYGSPIIATFHASWSLAACIGALIGYAVLNFNLSVEYHFLLISVFTFIIIVSNLRYLPSIKIESLESQEEEEKDEVKGIWYMIKHRIKPEIILIRLGLVWLLVLIVENTMFEWGDLFYKDVFHANERLRVGFLIFMVMIFTGRMLTNQLYKICKKTTVLQLAGGLIFIGFTMCGLMHSLDINLTAKLILTSIGFMLIGLGTSCVVPTIYSIVGDRAKTPTGIALTIMSSISFVGPLIQPLLMGGISHNLGLQWAYLCVGIVGVLILFSSRLDNKKK